MGHGEQEQWSGVDFLTQLSGLSAEASPVRALFLAHRVRASGRLWMTQGVEVRSLDLFEGELVGCKGFIDLIDGVEGERSWSLMDWGKAGLDAGMEAGDALNELGVALCKVALAVEDAEDWMVNFVQSTSPPDAPSQVPMGLTAALLAAIGQAVSDRQVRSWLEGVAAHGIETRRPVDAPTERWGLNAEMHRLLDAADRVDNVGAFFVEIGADGWSSLGVLWRLGLIGGTTQSEPTVPDTQEPEGEPATQADPVSTERPNAPASAAPTPPPPKPQQKAKVANPVDTPTSGSPAKTERPAKRRKKRRRDPRIVAILRAPYENPERMEAHLKEAYDVLNRMRPEVMFRLKTVADLELEKIERRHRDACSRYHPDRYRNASQGVQVLAEACFTLVSDAFHTLKDETYTEELRIRFVEKETGKRVVTDKTRSLAKVEFAKADVLFKQKRYDEAYDLASRAAEGDPERWQYRYLLHRAAYRSGKSPLSEVRDAIGSLSGMNSLEKGNSLYIVGEMYMREGDEEKAFELFRQALTLDEHNVGARRRLRLKDRRSQEANERESPGLFGGLFQRRKR